jgi:hypothetical protein
MNIRVPVYTLLFTCVSTLIAREPMTAVSRFGKSGMAKTENGMGGKA